MNFNTGFSRCDISGAIDGAIDDGTEFRDALEAQCCYISDGSESYIICALDLIEMHLDKNIFLQQEIAAACDIPYQQVLIHTTHNHSAPWEEVHGITDFVKKLGTLLIPLCLEAQQNLQAASMQHGTQNVGSELSINRRQYCGEELGHQCFWFGYKIDEKNRSDASPLIKEMKARWKLDSTESTQEPPVYFDHEVDPLVQCIAFYDTSDHCIGSIVRFSAHPHIASCCRDKLYDPDFPGVVRKQMEKSLGAPCLFLLGPSGNLSPKDNNTFTIDTENVPPLPYLGPISNLIPESDQQVLSEMQRIGTAIADAAIAALNNRSKETISQLQFMSQEHPLQLNPDLPPDNAAIEAAFTELDASFEQFKQGKLDAVATQELARQANWLEWAKKTMVYITDDDRRAGHKNMPLSVLRLNDLSLIFLHSEISLATTLAIRQAHGDESTCIVSLTGGSVEYIPTQEMIAEGGYEGLSTIISDDAELQLRQQVISMINTK
ncbi:MAG: hypothetical protein HRU15_14895 [Planctomycetes bacterium]|nr:hypothetical protein [Planctomycetota bacterium]